MKWILPITLWAASAGLLRADVIQSLSIDLSALHAGSVLSGSVVLQNPLVLGDSVQIPLTFSDPADYSPTSLLATLSVTNGVPEDQFRFSDITFTELVHNKTYTLSVHGAAVCPIDFPCEATGRYEANSPPAFSGSYTVANEAAPSGVPEPAYGWLVSGLGLGVVLGRRLLSGRRGLEPRTNPTAHCL